MSNAKREGEIAALILGLSAALLIGHCLLLGYYYGRRDIRNEAILHKAAYYAIDTNGNPIFTWNTSTP